MPPFTGVGDLADYAIDSMDTTDVSDYIVDYLALGYGPKSFFYCNAQGLHYFTDPTGWAIQPDLTLNSGKLCNTVSVGSTGKMPPPETCPCFGISYCSSS
jgi:hypothetical protein